MSGSNGKSGEIGVPPEVLAAEKASAEAPVPHPPEHGGAEGVEPDTPPTGRLFFQIAVLGVVVVGLLIGLWQYFKLDTTAEVYRKELSVPNRELEELVARDEGRLTQYDVVDEKKGVYQIPVRRAMELIVEEPPRLAPAPGAPAPASAPAAAAGAGAPALSGAPAAPRGGGSPLLDPAPEGESR